MDEALGAGKSERTEGRLGYRSGQYSRTLSTRVGKLELRAPQDRQGRFRTEVFERYQRSEKALVGPLAEMYVQGVSTRKVKAITVELCGHEVSAATVSRMKRDVGHGAGEVRQAPAGGSLPVCDSGCALREGAGGRGDPEPGGADRHRGGLGGAAERAGGGAGQPGIGGDLEGFSGRAEAAGAARGGVCLERRSSGLAEGDPGGVERGGVAALLCAFPAQRAGLSAAQGRRRVHDGAAVDLRPPHDKRRRGRIWRRG